ncbi:MAG: hypothetical protein J6S29_00835, partial [Methanosphaera sp.]|nr:hypothetical protein [Methanosphaera sp.]
IFDDVNAVFVPLKSVEVTDGIIIIPLTDILSYSDGSTSYPLNMDYLLSYVDTTGQYQNITTQSTLYIYNKSNNVLDVSDVTGYLNDYIRPNVTLKDDDGTILISDVLSYTYYTEDILSVECIETNRGLFIEETYEDVEIYLSSNYFDYGSYTLKWYVFMEDGSVVINTSMLNIVPKPKSSTFSSVTNLTVYMDDNEVGTSLEVYDEYDNLIDSGTVTVKLDGEIVTTVDLNEHSYYWLQVDTLDVGEHVVTLTYGDNAGNHPSNETSFILTKSDAIKTAISIDYPKIIMDTEETFDINFTVYSIYDYEEVTEGTVDLVIYIDEYNWESVTLNTVAVTDKKITVDVQSILNYNMEYWGHLNNPVYNPFYLLYRNSSQDYLQATVYCEEGILIYKASNLTVEVPDMEGYIDQSLDVQFDFKDENGEVTYPDVNRVDVKCVETGNYVLYDEYGGLYIYSSAFDGEGSYTLEWKVIFDDDTVAYTTSTLNVIPKPKETRLPPFDDKIVYKNQYSWSIWVHVSDENYETIYYGTISVLLDDVIVDTDSLDGNYDVYCSIDLADVSFGEHTVTITYTDENGEHPDNTTSFTLTKKDMLKTDMSISIDSDMIMITDENVEVKFDVYDTDTYESVQTGIVTFFLDMGEFILLNSVDVTDGKIIVDMDSILSNYDTPSYPLYVDAGLMYNDTTEQYQDIFQWYAFDIYDKIPVVINYNRISVNITDEKTTFDLIVNDYDGNPVPNGKIDIIGYIEDVEFNAEATVTDGIATVTITEPNFNDYMGYDYQFVASYTDDNNVYNNAHRTFYNTVRESLILEINDTIMPRGKTTTINYVIKDKNGEIIYPYIDSFSFSSDNGYFSHELYEEINRLDLYSDSQAGEYIINLLLYTDENSEAKATFKVTLKDVQSTDLRYIGYDSNEESTTFNYKVTYYDDTSYDWTGLVDQGTVNITLTIDDAT